jgi:hypothetical protein
MRDANEDATKSKAVKGAFQKLHATTRLGKEYVIALSTLNLLTDDRCQHLLLRLSQGLGWGF